MPKIVKIGLLISVLLALVGCSTTKTDSEQKKKEPSYERFHGRFER